MKTIAETIRTNRLQSELSQQELAEKVGVRAQQVSNWERGLGTPKAANAVKLSGVLGGKVEDYIDRAPVGRTLEQRLPGLWARSTAPFSTWAGSTAGREIAIRIPELKKAFEDAVALEFATQTKNGKVDDNWLVYAGNQAMVAVWTNASKAKRKEMLFEAIG